MKKEIKDVTITVVFAIMAPILLFVVLDKYNTKINGERSLANSLHYLELIVNGSKENYEIFSIETLKKSVIKDDLIIKDLRKRELIPYYSLYNDLNEFRNSEKMTNKLDEEDWIDYSNQTIKGNLYKVPVSDSICKHLNTARFKRKVSCLDNIAKFYITNNK